MTQITQIVLFADPCEPGVQRLSDWLANPYQVNALKRLNPNEVFTAIHVTDVNHLDTDTFLQVFKETPWRWSESVQLLVKGEYDERFTVHEPPDEYSPAPSMRLDRALQIARLWARGKLIGGDAHEVCEALLAEVERLQTLLAAPITAAAPPGWSA